MSNNNKTKEAPDNVPMSIERKLELLESRFTTPANGLSSQAGHAEPPTATSAVADEGINQHSSPSSIPSSGGSKSNHSEHSFAFTTPMSRGTNNTASNLSGASNLPASSVRSRRRPSVNSSFHAVSMAATRHMRKVATSSAFHQHSTNSNASIPLSNSLLVVHDGNRSMSGLPSPANSFASTRSASNQTLPTSHLRTNTQLSSQRQGQAKGQEDEQRVVAESPPVQVTPHGPPTASVATSNPLKPSAARNLLLPSTQVPVTPKRKPVPKRKKSSIVDKSIVASPSDSRKRPRRHSNPAESLQATSPKSQQQSSIAAAFAHAEHSRERSNPPNNKKNTSKTKPQANKAPSNNTTLLDYFASGSQKKKSAIPPPNANLMPTTVATSAAAPAGDANNEWYQKCVQLQQDLQDKNEQIKAITNNRTIYQTAIQTALTQKKEELAQVKAKMDDQTKLTSKVIEDLLRWKSSRQAKELREKLAADGARLGRIVVSRAGMRAVESWEEGHATRDLEHRKLELKAKRTSMERRLASHQAKSVINKEYQNQEAEDGEHSADMATLEMVEAKEAVRMHLDNLKRKEQELREEEQALNDEKAAHIRALKRVASEDSSRFRSRPKLHNRYVLHCLLGKGGFSEVWRGYDLMDLREVAVKIHQLDPRWSDSKKENYTRHVSREYEIHRNVRHERIVSLYNVFEIDNNSFATVLECCKGTDLDSLLKEKKRLPERDARAILLQILTGMQYLSQPSADGTRQGIIHYDLKPGNILFDEHGDAKITDFGLSKIVDTPDPAESMELTSQGAGTYWYLPPECFITSERVRISNKVDVWSIGVIYYQMLYGSRPFGEGKSQDKLLSDHTMLNAQQVTFPEQPRVSEAGKSFLRQCLTYDQAFRPTVAQLCENPYILKRQF